MGAGLWISALGSVIFPFVFTAETELKDSSLKHLGWGLGMAVEKAGYWSGFLKSHKHCPKAFLARIRERQVTKQY